MITTECLFHRLLSGIGGSVVECPLLTRAARVQVPADARHKPRHGMHLLDLLTFFFKGLQIEIGQYLVILIIILRKEEVKPENSISLFPTQTLTPNVGPYALEYLFYVTGG